MKYCYQCCQETQHSRHIITQSKGCGCGTILLVILTLGLALIYLIIRKKKIISLSICETCGHTIQERIK